MTKPTFLLILCDRAFLDAYGTLRKVGVLRRHAGASRERVTYEHDLAWLASPDAFQFDPTLPLQRGTLHPGEGREMFGTLGDSAPDGVVTLFSMFDQAMPTL